MTRVNGKLQLAVPSFERSAAVWFQEDAPQVAVTTT